MLLFTTAALALVSGIALVQTAVKIPFPQKWVWTVGFGILFANGLLNFLYQLGGKYVVVLPVLYPLQSAFDTTGTLGLIIGAYSGLHGNTVSSHWYSLPTGCAPLAMVAQYVPTLYMHMTICAVFLAYVFASNAKQKSWVLPTLFLVASAVVRELGISVVGLTADDLSNIFLAFATLVFLFLATGQPLSVGGKKFA